MNMKNQARRHFLKMTPRDLLKLDIKFSNLLKNNTMEDSVEIWLNKLFKQPKSVIIDRLADAGMPIRDIGQLAIDEDYTTASHSHLRRFTRPRNYHRDNTEWDNTREDPVDGFRIVNNYGNNPFSKSVNRKILECIDMLANGFEHQGDDPEDARAKARYHLEQMLENAYRRST